jgi:hypothetical protein
MKIPTSPLRQSTLPRLALRASASRLALVPLAAGACTMLVPPKAANAEQYAWKPNYHGSWFDFLNWRLTASVPPFVPPGPNDEANITFGGTAHIANGGTAEAQDLYVGRNLGSSGAVAVSNGTLKANRIFLGLRDSSNGEMTVSGGQSRVEVSDQLFIGGPSTRLAISIGDIEGNESESIGGPHCRALDGLLAALRSGLDAGPLRDLRQGLRDRQAAGLRRTNSVLPLDQLVTGIAISGRRADRQPEPRLTAGTDGIITPHS